MSVVGKQLGLWVGKWLGGIEAGPNNLAGTAQGTSVVVGLIRAAGAVAQVDAQVSYGGARAQHLRRLQQIDEQDVEDIAMIFSLFRSMVCG